jgi:hypothetical protein
MTFVAFLYDDKIIIRSCSPHASSKPPTVMRLVNNSGESTCKDAIVFHSCSFKMRTCVCHYKNAVQSVEERINKGMQDTEQKEEKLETMI